MWLGGVCYVDRLCGPIGQMTLRSSDMGSHKELYYTHPLTFKMCVVFLDPMLININTLKFCALFEISH